MKFSLLHSHASIKAFTVFLFSFLSLCFLLFFFNLFSDLVSFVNSNGFGLSADKIQPIPLLLFHPAEKRSPWPKDK